jgi:hypothetical protein
MDKPCIPYHNYIIQDEEEPGKEVLKCTLCGHESIGYYSNYKGMELERNIN